MRTVSGEYKHLQYGLTTAKRGYPPGALSECVNFIPKPGGSLARRPGARLVKSFPIVSDLLVGQPITVGDRHCMFAAPASSRITTLINATDGEVQSSAHGIDVGALSMASIRQLDDVFNIGPGVSIGEWTILPAATGSGAPISIPIVFDTVDFSNVTNLIAIQPIGLQQSTQYEFTIKYRPKGGGAEMTRRFWIKTADLEFPEQLDISDIPAIVGNGQANPNYSQAVSQRQAEHSKARASWIKNVTSINSVYGFLGRAVQVVRGDSSPDSGGLGGFGGDGPVGGMQAFTAGQSFIINVPSQYEILSADIPPGFKRAWKQEQSVESLPANSAEGHAVRIGQSDTVLEYRGGIWKEVPRMSVSGGLSLVMTKASGNTFYFNTVRYGDIAPTPTAAPEAMANALKNAGAPIRTMYINGRFCVVCERAILASAADKPLNFFPKAAGNITAGDGAPVEISKSSSEYIIDAVPCRLGAFVLTNTGAYVVNLADIRSVSIQKVRDASFPGVATHHILNVNGAVWHYWRTASDQAVRVYTESNYGGVWTSSDPIPHYDMSKSRIPFRTSMAASSSGDTVYISMDRTIKTFRVGEHTSVFDMNMSVGDIAGLAMSGDSLVIFSNRAGYAYISEYSESSSNQYLDLWCRTSDKRAPVWAKAVNGAGISTPKEYITGIPTNADIVFGNAYKSSLTLAPPQETDVATPPIRYTFRDVEVHVNKAHDFVINTGQKPRQYSDPSPVKERVRFAGDTAWRALHHIHRPGPQNVTILTGGTAFSEGPMEITHVTYRLFVYNDETPSSWA